MAVQPILTAVIEPVTVTSDTLRLLIVFAFGYGAVLDYRTRRVYNEFWIPLIGLCFIVLAWDIAMLVMISDAATSDFLWSFSVSILVVPSIAFTLWQTDVFGGADLKAIAFLAVFFPRVPEITISGVTYPYTPGVTSIFTLTVLVNGIIIASAYRFFLFGKNFVEADISRLMTRATKCNTETLVDKHGDIIQLENKSRSRSVDIDTVRMYLQWRGITLENLCSNSDFYKTTEPAIENAIGDGGVPSTKSTPLGHSEAEFNPGILEDNSSIIPLSPHSTDTDDPWAADTFVQVVEDNNSHITETADDIRIALDEITETDEVWITPSIPFFIPLTIGLVIALIYGSLFIGGTEWIADMIVSVFIEN